MSGGWHRRDFASDHDFFLHVNEHRLHDTLGRHDRGDFDQWLSEYTAGEDTVTTTSTNDATSPWNQDDLSNIFNLPPDHRMVSQTALDKKRAQLLP
ncbi:hypothetical protein ColTof4_14313 [Colletotrichum tofieldiae]|nr:hypothetical protein ColTof4_14313 [Colletotrichum tofieldiae]